MSENANRQHDPQPKREGADLVRRSEETPQERLARLAREKKAADLRYKLARLEAGEDVDVAEVGEGSVGPSAPMSAEMVMGGLGNLAKTMGSMFVEDETAADKEGNTIKFARRAGTLKNVKIDLRTGRPIEADFTPDEWPPRHESF